MCGVGCLVMSGWLVALDFGTTATAVAVRSGDGVARSVVFGDGSSTPPSSVFAENDGRLLVGTEADNEAELRLSAYEPTPKRRISDGQIRLGDRDFSVPEVIGAVMAPALAEAMQQNNNTAPSQVVLTHPVAWRARRRAVLAEALNAAQAQLGVRLPEPVFVAEPVAAAQWYTQTDPARPGAYFAVYDLGGGTFDTTVLKATSDGFEVVASGGIDPLGGFDFDAALFDYLGRQYIEPANARLWSGLSTPGQPDPELARQRRRLQQRVGLIKLGLSTSPDKRIQLPEVDNPVVVTRGEYEALITGHIDATIGELESTITDAGLTPGQLTAIYRIGGAARTPLVGAALDRLRVPVKVLDQPKLVVAQGAATRTDMPGRIPRREPPDDVNHRPRESADIADATGDGPPAPTPHPPAGALPDTPSESAEPPAGPSRSTVIALSALGVVAFLIVMGIIGSQSSSNSPSNSNTAQPNPSDTTQLNHDIFGLNPTDTAQPNPGDTAQPNPGDSAQPSVGTPSTETGPPQPSLPDADAQGFVGYPGARCDPGSSPAVMARTTQSVLVICEIGPANYYYRGVRLSDSARIELANAVRSSDGFDVTNPNDGTRYEVRPTGISITSPGGQVSSEPMIEYAAR